MDRKDETKKSVIKVKINGEERPFTEDNQWLTTKAETSAAAEEPKEEDEDFDWLLPNIDNREIPVFQKVNHFPSKRKKQLPFYWRRKLPGVTGAPNMSALIISIVLAVAVGFLLGSFILKMLKHPEEGMAVNSMEEAPVKIKEEVEKEMGGKTFTAELPAFTAAVIQGGVFSSKKAAEEAASSFKAQGLGITIMEMDGKHYLFTGVTNSIPDAKSWQQRLGEAGTDVWAKEVSMDSAKIAFVSKEEAEQAAAEGALFQTLASETVSGITTGSVNESAMADLEKVFAKGDIKRSQDGAAYELSNKLHHAYQGLKEFQKNASDQSPLQKSQQYLLDYMKIYKEAGQ